MFGGIQRARISSQCLKQRIRSSTIFTDALTNASVELGIRTRELPEIVREKLRERGMSDELAKAAMEILVRIGKKEKKEKAAEEEGGDEEGEEESEDDEESPEEEAEEKKRVKTKQIMFFSPGDINAVTDIIEKEVKGKTPDTILEKDPKKRKNQLKRIEIAIRDKKAGITPDIALFGRMITSIAFRNVDAAMQVAHAISTNEMAQEFDFYTAVDDRNRERMARKGGDEAVAKEGSEDTIEEDAGAGMMGDIEFTSACFYKYFSLDTDAFMANLAGGKGNPITPAMRALLPLVVGAFLETLVFASPTGKQNSFAAHQLPDAILIEAREKKIPVSYANAFIEPCRPSTRKDLVAASIDAMINHVKTISAAYGIESRERFWFSPRGTAAAWSAKPAKEPEKKEDATSNQGRKKKDEEAKPEISVETFSTFPDLVKKVKKILGGA